MPAVLLKIGAFAERGAVSVKTLRYYDEVGVLRAACVDAKSGYRYYRADQLATLAELRLLRELGATIADLKAWVTVNGEVAARGVVLTRLRERLQGCLGRDRARLRYLDMWTRQATLGGNLVPPLLPSVRNIPEIPALTLRERVDSAGPAIYQMFESAERAVARNAARAPHPPFLILHEGYNRRQRADVEVCVPILPNAITAVGGRVVPGARRAACIAFAGSYDQGPSALATLKAWARITGTRAAGPLRESYIRFGADQRGYRLSEKVVAENEADYRTELQLPISPS